MSVVMIQVSPYHLLQKDYRIDFFASPLATTTAGPPPTTTAAPTGCGYPQWKGDGFCDVRFS